MPGYEVNRTALRFVKSKTAFLLDEACRSRQDMRDQTEQIMSENPDIIKPGKPPPIGTPVTCWKCGCEFYAYWDDVKKVDVGSYGPEEFENAIFCKMKGCGVRITRDFDAMSLKKKSLIVKKDGH